MKFHNTTIKTNFKNFDDTVRINNSDLILIGGSHGISNVISTFILNIAKNVAIHCKSVLLFSLGIKKKDIFSKYKIENLNLYIEDSKNITISEIENKCIEKRTNIELIIIDYIQLVNEYQNSSQEIIYRLKELSQEIKIPIIITSLLSLEVELRDNHLPQLTDIENSQKIIDMIDTVILLNRDDYYDSDSENKNILDVIIAKNRENRLNIIKFVYIDNYNKFVELENLYKKFLIGITDKNAKIYIYKNLEGYNDLPFFSYEIAKQNVYENNISEILIQKPKLYSLGSRNLELCERNDLENFLYKLNTKKNCTNYEYIISVWNRNNNIKVPSNTHKPNYINLEEREFLESGIGLNQEEILKIKEKDELNNIKVGININETETKPHFHYIVSTGEEFAISMLEPKYLEPIPRKLNKDEVNILIMYLKKIEENIYNQKKDTNWNILKWLWNNINTIYNDEILYTKPTKVIARNKQMPDYTKLNIKE